jgi:hypothetical protein
VISGSVSAARVRLSIDPTVDDPADSMGTMFVNVLATRAEMSRA